jgi:hypothetical protein
MKASLACLTYDPPRGKKLGLTLNDSLTKYPDRQGLRQEASR